MAPGLWEAEGRVQLELHWLSSALPGPCHHHPQTTRRRVPEFHPKTHRQLEKDLRQKDTEQTQPWLARHTGTEADHATVIVAEMSQLGL